MQPQLDDKTAMETGFLCLFPSPRNRRCQGFTLVELILVLVLLGVLSAVVLPRFTSNGYAEYGYTEELASALRFAQQSAVAANTPITLTLASNHYRICRDTTCTSSGPFLINPGNNRPWDGSASGRGLAPNGVTLSPVTAITFNGLGVPSQGLSIQIGDRGLQLEAETGHVH
ncbi:GspH/FimT family protein [Nitrincola sp.]|uniref:GspH/FimT family protein n=1 Tax=Nitrincola sp. TaxID=1926584 RepID=UPI003A93B0DB